MCVCVITNVNVVARQGWPCINYIPVLFLFVCCVSGNLRILLLAGVAAFLANTLTVTVTSTDTLTVTVTSTDTRSDSDKHRHRHTDTHTQTHTQTHTRTYARTLASTSYFDKLCKYTPVNNTMYQEMAAVIDTLFIISLASEIVQLQLQLQLQVHSLACGR